MPYNGLFSSRNLLFSYELHSMCDIEHNDAVLLHYKDSDNHTEYLSNNVSLHFGNFQHW